MRTLAHLFLAGSLLIVSCQPKQNQETKVEPEDNGQVSLSQEEVRQGWQLLFDGKSLSGWRTFKNQPNDSWEVVDGTLHCQPFDSAQQRADLVTLAQFKNFEMQFDWKIGYQGNSGVMFRVTEEFDQPYLTGPEYQILDDVGYPGESREVNMTGANYDMQAAENKQVNPQGEWNRSKLLVKDNHVEHWLNGVMVLSYELGSSDWKKQKAGCKWNDVPSYGAAPQGHIALQDHSSEVWFKNILLRVL